MNDDRTLERAARSWLEAGPTQAPDRPVEAALRQIKNTPQERDLRIPWRFPHMTSLARIAVVAAIGVIALGGVLYIIRPPIGPGGQPTASPAPTAASIEGTWDADFTHAEMVAAGLVDAAEDNRENYGHFRLFLGGGVWELRQQDGPRGVTTGTYTVTGSTISLMPSAEQAIFVMPFTVTPTSLTLGSGGPVTFRVEPWVRVSP